MEKENKGLMTEETVLDSENEENGELSPTMKNIMRCATGMVMEPFAKILANPNAGKSLSDTAKDWVRETNKVEEDDEEIE